MSETATKITVAQLRDMLSRCRDDDKVVIAVTLPHATMGGRPCVGVTGAHAGFDWDHGKVFIAAEAKLHPVGDEFVQAKQTIHELSERIGFALIALRSNIDDSQRIKNAVATLTARPRSRAKASP